MSNRQTAWVAIATLTAAALGFAGARALATGAPQLSPLTYGGVLTDKDGKPYPSAQDVVLKFYDKVDATAAKCTAPATQAEAGTGRFSVVLPGECAQAVRDTPDLWSEATVGGGKTVLPRVHVGAVPYALEADSAKVAGSAEAASGALKVALDGVSADLAGLKKALAGGGAPKVVDGAGVVLGTLLEAADASRLHVLTPKGFLVFIDMDGKGCYHASLMFTGSNCTGNAAMYGYSPPGSPPTGPVTGLIAHYSKVTGSWYIPQTTGKGMIAPTLTAVASGESMNTGCAAAAPNSVVLLVPLVKATNADFGWASSPVGPLKIIQ